jgi:uncharacterized protein (DUF1778 family)
MGKASTKAQNKYIAKTYDRINFVVPKGHKDEIKAAADTAGESLNGYIAKAVVDRMTREKPS